MYLQLSLLFQVQYMPNFLCFGSVTMITTWRSSLQEGKKVYSSLSLQFNGTENNVMVDVWCEAMPEEHMRSWSSGEWRE